MILFDTGPLSELNFEVFSARPVREIPKEVPLCV